MSELERQIGAYLEELRRENASAHTIRNYGSDLRQFLTYLTPPDGDPPAPNQLDTLAFREWLGALYQKRLSPVTLRRKLAAVRSFCQFLVRNGRMDANQARLVATPKIPKLLPRVPNAEQTKSAENLAVMLSRYGLAAEIVRVASEDRTDAEALCDHQKESSAELTVAGAFGHARFREVVLGGVTHDLPGITSCPLLLVH